LIVIIEADRIAPISLVLASQLLRGIAGALLVTFPVTCVSSKFKLGRSFMRTLASIDTAFAHAANAGLASLVFVKLENRFRNFTAGTLFHCHGEILNRGMIPCQH